MKIFWHEHNVQGVGYWRNLLPIRHLKQFDITVSPDISTDISYDAYVFHGIPEPVILPFLKQIKQKNKILIYETDDDLTCIEQCNPVYKTFTKPSAQYILQHIKEESDYIITTTEELKLSIGMKDKTYVLPNLLDMDDWPVMNVPDRDYPLIMWAGSQHHLDDLDLLVEPLNKILEEYKEAQILFMGDMPRGMSQLKKIKYTYLAQLVPFNNRVGLIQAQDGEVYRRLLSGLQPDIMMCPLTNCKFNESKSNIKYLENSIVGAATVASYVGPYKNTITLKDNFYVNIKFLLENNNIRKDLANDAKEDVINNWTWQNSRYKDNWVNFFGGI